MNKSRKWAALLALGALASVLVIPAWAANRNNLAGSWSVPAINDTIYNQGASPDNSVGARFAAESTGVFTCEGYSTLLIYMRVIPPGGADTTSTATFAVLFKAIDADTARAVQPDSMAGAFEFARIAANAATTDSFPGQYTTDVVLPGTGAGGIFPGEWKEVFAPWQGRSPASGKSNQFFGRTTRCIPIAIKANHGQVRVRLMRYINASPTLKPKVQVWVEGVR